MKKCCDNCSQAGCFFYRTSMWEDNCGDFKAKDVNITDSFVEKSNKYKELLQEYEDYIESSAELINELEKWKKTAKSLLEESARALRDPDFEPLRSMAINGISSFLKLW